MAEARLHTAPRVYQFAAPRALVSGDILEFIDKAVVYVGAAPAAEGDLIAATSEGNYEIASASATTFSVGDPVYWDNTNKLAVTTPGDFLLGVAIKAKVDGQTVVLVALNEYVDTSS